MWNVRSGKKPLILDYYASGKRHIDEGFITLAIWKLMRGLRLVNEKFYTCSDKMCKSCRDFTLPYTMKFLLLLGFANIAVGKPELGFKQMASSLKVARCWKATFGK